MPIADVCHRRAVVAPKDLSIAEAAKLMRQHATEVLVIVQEEDKKRFPVGLLTDRAIVTEVVAEEKDAHIIQAASIMETELHIAHANDGIWDTLQRMRNKKTRHVPVVDEEGALLGIVSLDDLLDLLSEELVLLARLVSREG